MYVCMYVSLPKISSPMVIEQLRETIPLPKNTVRVCNQITLLILYCVISRLVTHLKITDGPIEISDIFI
jgi:hypothetical protein